MIGFTVLAYVVYATAGAHGLVPRLDHRLPGWEAGPVHALLRWRPLSIAAARARFSELLVAASLAYAAALVCARAISLRAIVAFAVVVNLALLLAPPAPLDDLFNYLGYARLFTAHGLNPYVSVIAAERHDPVYQWTTWHNLSSPYGPLFTALTLPIALLSLPAAYWVLKALIVACSLALLWAVHWVCRALGRDSRFPLLLLAANPVYLFYAVAGFHNDVLMLLPTVLAIGLLLRGHDRSAGALAIVAVAIKPTAIIMLPFLLCAAGSAPRLRSVLAGAALSAIPLLALSFALFGTATPNLAQQSDLVTGFSIPTLAGLALGLGGVTPVLVRLGEACVVAVVLWGLRRRDWIGSLGWATVALIASLAWLMPWYVIWALPLAGLATSRALRASVLALSVFVIATFMPLTSRWAQANGVDPLGTHVGLRHVAFERYLQYGDRCSSVRIRRDGEVVCAQRRLQRGAQRRPRDLVGDRRVDARADLA